MRSNFRNRNSGPPPGVAAAGEPFVSPLTTGVSPAPLRMTSSGYLFDVHRYVTWVNLTCMMGGTDRCPGARDGKRITVAVRPIAAQQLQAGSKPVWVTTVLTDPNSVAAGATPPTRAGRPDRRPRRTSTSTTRAATRRARQTLTAGHDARDTGQSLSCAGTNNLRPDLMGTTRAPGDDGTVMFNYSQDYPYARIGGSTAPGLGLLPPLPATPSCPTSYAAGTAAIDKHRVHRWVTPADVGDVHQHDALDAHVLDPDRGGADGRGHDLRRAAQGQLGRRDRRRRAGDRDAPPRQLAGRRQPGLVRVRSRRHAARRVLAHAPGSG